MLAPRIERVSLLLLFGKKMLERVESLVLEFERKSSDNRVSVEVDADVCISFVL